jgi:hypothetical protein
MLYAVTLIEGTAMNANWLDFWRDKLGATSGTASAASSAGGSVSLITVSGVVEGDLGGSRQVGVSHTTWVPTREYRDWECPSDGTYRAVVEVWTDNAATSVTPRIYDVTGAGVAQTGSVSTSTTPASQPISFSAVAGHIYRLELLPGNTSNDVYGIGKVRT